METLHVFPALDGPVLTHILGKREHKALAPVHHIDTPALRLGEPVRRIHGISGYPRTYHQEHDTEKAYLLERCFYIL